PRPIEDVEHASASSNGIGKTPAVDYVDIGAVLEIRPFERFVFVMSVLEQYSVHECAVLLGASRRNIITARICALQQLRTAMELSKAAANVGPWNPDAHNTLTHITPSAQ